MIVLSHDPTITVRSSGRIMTDERVIEERMMLRSSFPLATFVILRTVSLPTDSTSRASDVSAVLVTASLCVRAFKHGFRVSTLPQ